METTLDVAAPSDRLVALAQRYGVATDYWDWQGVHRPVSAATVRTVLSALGVAAGDDAAIEASLHAADERPWRRTLPPTVVAREGWTPWVPVHVPHGSHVALVIELEDGTTRLANQVNHWVEPRWIDGALIGEATFELPGDLPLGWHQLHAHVGGDSMSEGEELDEVTTATLVVTPQRLELPALARNRVWGLGSQLYQARSSRSWGIGDLRDLGTLATWGGDLGAGFLLVNPLHAPQPVSPIEPSPYLPTTRRFSDPIFLVIDEIPEYADLPAPQRAAVDAAAAQARALNTVDFIDRDAVWALKRPALEALYAVEPSPERRAEFTAYCDRQGGGLTDFATWCALAVHFGPNWNVWPPGFGSPHTEAVTAYRLEHASDVDFYRWLQWLLDAQLHRAQTRALAAGMPVGIVKDLAVGVHPDGADAWALASVLARGATVGAPPDQFNQLGQNWHQPPWRPDRLAEVGYAPYRDMLRTVLKDSGGIRIDHVIGLFRLWWVPVGETADKGTYVRFDYEALVGILALEAQRAGAVVIGEDLGVVEPMARQFLLERGILGTSILWFEWGEDGRPLAPERYRDLCLTAVTTHDLPPTAGYLQLEHVAIRERLHLLTRAVDEERAIESAAIDQIKHLLTERSLLGEDPTIDDVVVALHRLISMTPSRMLLAALADLVGDRRAINQPGTEDEYPNWRLPLADAHGRILLLDDLVATGLAARIAEAIKH